MKNMIKLFVTILLVTSSLFPWGGVGHKLINKNCTKYFPQAMNNYKSWQTYLEAHASDADYRKSDDPTEGKKHYLDIDNYQEFFQNKFPYSIDSLINKYGLAFVEDQGILPWAILNTYDSLKIYLAMKNWSASQRLAADLGHYIGDMCNPLHITRNYDGQYTNQKGIHSRYESSMMNYYKGEIIFLDGIGEYINDPVAYVFQSLISNYKILDTILQADIIATQLTGSTSSTQYYAELWKRCGDKTKYLFNFSAKILASVIYTAWVNAGRPEFPLSSVESEPKIEKFELYQNYPNPFNYSTIIKFYVPDKQVGESVTITITDTLGKEIGKIFEGVTVSGNNHFELDAKMNNLSTGTYFYRVKVGTFEETKKLIYLK